MDTVELGGLGWSGWGWVGVDVVGLEWMWLGWSGCDLV